MLDEGRALYHGQSVWRRAPTLSTDVSLPTNAAACGDCHGPRGEGSREGGVLVPALRGREAAELLNAAREGRTAQGRRLQAPMPRYAFSDDEARALGAYLAQLGSATDNAAGVDAQAVQWATLVPRRGAHVSEAMRSAADDAVRVMRAQFARLNAAGGAYGREVRLEVFEFEPGAAALPEALVHALKERRIFALVGSLVGSVPEAWARELSNHRTPMLANLLPAAQSPSTPWVTHLMPALADQARRAMAELERRCGAESSGTGGRSALWLVHTQHHADVVAALSIPADRVITAALPPDEARCVLSLLPPPAHAELRRALQQSSRAGPHRPAALGAIGMVSGGLGADATAQGVVELSITPSLPDDVGNSQDRRSLWQALGELAARVAIEALSRSGRDLHAVGLRRALESMTGYEALPGVALQFSPHQRAGLALTSQWSTSP